MDASQTFRDFPEVVYLGKQLVYRPVKKKQGETTVFTWKQVKRDVYAEIRRNTESDVLVNELTPGPPTTCVQYAIGFTLSAIFRIGSFAKKKKAATVDTKTQQRLLSFFRTTRYCKNLLGNKTYLPGRCQVAQQVSDNLFYDEKEECVSTFWSVNENNETQRRLVSKASKEFQKKQQQYRLQYVFEDRTLEAWEFENFCKRGDKTSFVFRRMKFRILDSDEGVANTMCLVNAKRLEILRLQVLLREAFPSLSRGDVKYKANIDGVQEKYTEERLARIAALFKTDLQQWRKELAAIDALHAPLYLLEDRRIIWRAYQIVRFWQKIEHLPRKGYSL